LLQQKEDGMQDSAREAELGLVQVYTGDGKGKTTAALGLALRAAGWGYRTFIGQFMKGQDYGELHSIALLAPYVVLEQFGQPNFTRLGQADPEAIAMTDRGLGRIREVMASGAYRIIVLDEICMALYFKLAQLEDVLELIAHRPQGVEMILTGRRAPQALLDKADLVTEMREVKHPYQRSIPARRGIEL
jgi:cob(I)alamin adenosyltransferase